MNKKRFLLPLIASVLMLGVFIFLFIDLRKKDNTYIKDTKQNQVAKEEAEAVILFNDIKKQLEIPHIVTTKKEFNWVTETGETQTIKGWSIYSRINPNIVDKAETYLLSKNLKRDEVNNNKTVNTIAYKKDKLVCLITKAIDDTTIELDCGYIN